MHIQALLHINDDVTKHKMGSRGEKKTFPIKTSDREKFNFYFNTQYCCCFYSSDSYVSFFYFLLIQLIAIEIDEDVEYEFAKNENRVTR